MSSEAELSLIEEPTDVSIGPATREPTDISMNMAGDRRLELLDLDARDCPELRCRRLDAHGHDPAEP